MGAFFRRDEASFPRKPWLVPDPELREKWRLWLDAMPGPRVGIAWTGGMFLTNREGRSATLDDFLPVMKQAGTIISLEYRDDEEPIKEWNKDYPEYQVIRPPIDVNNYDDTVALLAELDRVVSVTTTIVHACGALGRQCDCIVPAVLTSSQWRYGLEGDEMLWYPKGSVKMHRQKHGEEGLSAVIKRVVR
jgi:hypothetical protein